MIVPYCNCQDEVGRKIYNDLLIEISEIENKIGIPTISEYISGGLIR